MSSANEAGRTPIDLPIGGSGTAFIEASAGTGKTHALTTLVARLIVEEGWRIDRILVVTFTRAATAELRDRIRRTLGAVLAAVKPRVAGAVPEGRAPAPVPRSDEPAAADDVCPPGAGAEARDTGGDPQAEELLAEWDRAGGVDMAEAARRLEAALHDIDRASVCTIHGFCQRALADLAFESGFPFGFEVSGDDDGMVAGAVRDFWRRRLYPASGLLMRHVVENGFLPRELAGWVSSRRSRAGATVLGGEPLSEPLDTWEAAWRGEFEASRVVWERHRDAFSAELLGGNWVNRNRYRRPTVEQDLTRFETMFAAAEPRLPAEGAVGRYGRKRLSEACKTGCTLPENPLFEAFDRLEEASRELRAVFDRWLRWARREALDEVRESVHRRVREDRRLGYNDLLIELDGALRSTGGARLAARIRREYPCALVDEYQDTDPVQARVFARIYGEAGDRAAPAGREEPAGGGRQPGPEGPEGPERIEPAGEPGWETDGPGAGEGMEGDGPAAAARTEPDAPSGGGGWPGHGGGTRSGPAAGNERLGPFIVVGDPKQSIYRFRGADVFAYLAARRTARERLPLGRNWRSVPALVEAVNAVFDASAPFVVPEIEYRPVAPARPGGNPLHVAPDGCGAPFRFWLIPPADNGRPRTKDSARPIAVDATANEIVRLLELGPRGEAVIEGKALSGADIAVLVRTRAQGRSIADALRVRGVRSVELDDRSVFETREAEQIERLLWALIEPGREARVRGALAGDLFGLDAPALLALDEDEPAWGEWAERLAGWRSEWEARGIGPVLLRLLEREGGAERLLAHPHGVRRLTNVRHLAELLQEAQTERRLAPVELAAWLSRRRSAGAEGPDESAQLRLESDEQLVRILTVHGAKGLEFPVVFYPFAWDARAPGRSGGAGDAAYHLGETQDYCEVLDLDPDERAWDRAWLEEFSESLRLFYVALTRAKYRCVVAWGQVRAAEHAPLAWLLHRTYREPSAEGSARSGADSAAGPNGAPIPGSAAVADPGRGDGPQTRVDGAAPAVPTPGPVPEDGPRGGSFAAGPEDAGGALRAAADRFATLGTREWREEVEAYAHRFPDRISVTALDPEPGEVRSSLLSAASPPALAAHGLDRPLRRIRQMTSFSALSADAHSAGVGIAADASAGRSPAGPGYAELEQPDHDQHEEPAGDAPAPGGSEAGAEDQERTVFTFPRGPVAGSCLHRIFEKLDESSGSDSGEPGLDALCREALEDFGIAGEWRPAARTMVEQTRALRLREPGRDGAGATGGFRLRDPVRRLVELEFRFPVDGLDRGRLGERLAEHGYPDPFAGPAESAEEGERPPIHGFLRGFVDLVVEHAGRWYVIDYKSNWLGAGPGDYEPDALAGAMRASGYSLQYLIYLVALHRYLAVRLPGYDCERHLGGTFYLFVRGIDPAAGMSRGVYFDRPSAACLQALDDCFRGGGMG